MFSSDCEWTLRCKEPVGVLVENVVLPKTHRKKEHVVAVGGRPVWDGRTGFVTGHQAAEPEEEKSRSCRQPGKPPEPGMLRGTYHR